MSLSFLIASVSAGPPNTTGVGPIPSPSPALTIGECVGSLRALDPPINLRNFENYDSWFDEHSSMTVAQTGTYIGVDDIKEYVRFGFPSSPYIAARGTFAEASSFVSFDEEKRSCVVNSKFHSRYHMSEMAGNALFEYTNMYNVEWRFDEKKIGKLSIYYDKSVHRQFWTALSQSASVDSFVCQTMRDSCPAVWAANDLTSLGECEAKLAALPLAEGEEFYMDGNTSSCRRLHAVYAATNDNHCAHLSFKPMADPKGKVKCQESAQLQESTIFSDEELAAFAAFEAEAGFESGQHWKLSPCQTQADCPAAGDPEEDPENPTGGNYTKDSTCVFGAPAERRLLFGSTPAAGVCVST